jgi:hypothetical protein
LAEDSPMLLSWLLPVDDFLLGGWGVIIEMCIENKNMKK